MAQRGYTVFYKDNTDSVYVKPGIVALTRLDRLKLGLKNLCLDYRRTKKRLLGGGAQR